MRLSKVRDESGAFFAPGDFLHANGLSQLGGCRTRPFCAIRRKGSNSFAIPDVQSEIPSLLKRALAKNRTELKKLQLHLQAGSYALREKIGEAPMNIRLNLSPF